MHISHSSTYSKNMTTDRRDILPGVTERRTPPAVVFDSQSAIRRARMRAILTDATQIVLLLAVDYLFVHFPSTHVPFANRHNSVRILVATNIVMLAYLAISRSWPRWRARRIANTWAAEERKRFFDR